MKRRLLSALLPACLCSLILASPVIAQDSLKDMKTTSVVETFGNAAVNWSEGYVHVTGIGNPPDRGEAVQRRLSAERSATADAYRQLAQAIYGIRVNSDTLVRDYVSESDAIKSYVNALIKGAQKMDQRYLDDGTIEIDFAVKLYSNSGLSGVLQPQKHVVPPPPVTIEAGEAKEEYTGIIVDCRGLGMDPAMSPAIVSQNGGELYLGQLEVKPEFVINEGIVGYAHSLLQARQYKRVGNKPLIIKGMSAVGNFHTDVQISEADTKLLLALDKSGKLLQDAKVVFVL